MPMWAPPTPPQDDKDVYMDHTTCFLYEPSVMPESQLPPIYVKKEHKRQRVDPAVVTRKHKVRKEEEARVPRSLFDRPSSLLRRESKLPKKHLGLGYKGPNRPTSGIMQRPIHDSGTDHPEWLIHEDWALLQAVQMLLELPLNLQTTSPAHIPNWDLIADVVNSASRTYRSAKQCKNRYESTVIPREEGRILYDMNPRKQKKTKGIYKVYNTKNNRPMRTSQLYTQDNNGSLTQLYSHRFDSCKAISSKRTPTLRPTLANPTLKNLKHAAVLAENGISYDTPLSPIQVAQIRAERIQKEKKEQLAAQKTQLVQSQSSSSAGTPSVSTVSQASTLTVVQATQLQAVATAAGTTVVPASNLKTVAAVSLGTAKAGLQPTGSIVVNTQQGVQGLQGNLSQITRKLQAGQTVVGSLAQNVIAASTVNTLTRALPGRSATLPSVNVHEITAAVNQGQARLTATGNTASTLATTQLVAQKTVQGTAQSLSTTKTLAILQQQQNQQKQALIRQQQQRRAALQVSQVQQGVQKTVAVTTPLISTQFTGARLQMASKDLAGATQKRFTTNEMAVLLQRQQTRPLGQASTPQVRQVQVSQATLAANRLTTAQIIQGSHIGASAQTTQPIATLVKTVSATQAASVPSVTIPVSAVSLGINLPQQKTLGKATAQPAAAQLQVRQLQQPRKAVAVNRIATLTGTKPGTPLIIPPRHQPLSLQAIRSIMNQQMPQGSGSGMQQIITSVAPATTVIATQIVTAGAQTLARLSVPSATALGAQARGTAGAQVLGTNQTGTPTVTLTPTGNILNRQVHEVLVSSAKQPALAVQSPQLKAGVRTLPAGTLPASISISQAAATLQQQQASSSPASAGGPTLTLPAAQALTVQQLHAAAQTKQVTPSPGAQQAVKQVIQQAQAQAQQRQTLPQPTSLTLPATTSLTLPTLPATAPPTVAVSQLPAAQTAVTAAGVLIQAPAAGQQAGEKNTYTMRLRNPPKPP